MDFPRDIFSGSKVYNNAKNLKDVKFTLEESHTDGGLTYAVY